VRAQAAWRLWYNRGLKQCSAGKKMARILEETKREVAYFTSEEGNRGGYSVYSLAQVSELPALRRLWFLTFDAKVEFMPAMTPEDLQKAGLEA
jgi:hypothetical protein